MPVGSADADGSLLGVLSWGYDTAIVGGMGIDSAIALGDRFRARPGSLRERTDSLIRWQQAGSAVCGVIGGVWGGPVGAMTAPMATALVVLVQLRMIAAIAHMGDHDVRTDEVRTLACACLCGAGLGDVMNDMGFAVGKGFAKVASKKISKAALKRVSQAAARRLLGQWGEQGIVAVAKAAPVVGAVAGAYLETRNTRAVGRVAQDWFIS